MGIDKSVPRRRRVWQVVIALLCVITTAGVGMAIAVARSNSDSSDAVSESTTATASLTTMEKTITASGTLSPAVTETAAFAAAGTVTEVLVAEGDTVAEGDELARIDTLSLNQSLLSARVDYLEARADYDEAVANGTSTDISSARVSAAKAAYKIAKQTYRDAKAAMSDQVLTAPVAGLVTSVDIEVGDVVGGSGSQGGLATSGGGTSSMSAAPGGATSSTTTTTTDDSASITIVGQDAWQVTTTVSESDIANVSVGLQAELTADDLDGTVFGVIAAVGKLPSASTGAIAYPVTIEVTGSPTGLYDGISVDVSLIYQRRTDVLTVPAAAVTTADGESTVEVVAADGTVTSTAVEIGETSGDRVEITSGLDEGAEVSYIPFTGSGNSGGSDRQGMMPGGTMPEGTMPGGFGGQGGPPAGFSGGPGGGQG